MLLLNIAFAKCPFMGGTDRLQGKERRRNAGETHGFNLDKAEVFGGFQNPAAKRPPPGWSQEAVEKIDWDALKKDLIALMRKSQEFWPSDYNHYGPLLIRLAWHAAGSYRRSDGRGGADGGLMRFDPERSWEDNTNLDKARSLLVPIKLKYGPGLSWGDLFVYAGNVAMEDMNGPVLGFCAGRIDDPDSYWTAELGPTVQQQLRFPCETNGLCKEPLGSHQPGLIYVNPEGPQGKPDPAGSAVQIREVFGRMEMNDVETVALVGGGHSWGKNHGACPKGAGMSPKQDPSNPWPGLCGTGKGADTYTAGFEGAWTTTPINWNNEYFKLLVKYDGQWEKYKGSGNKYQWRVANGKTPLAPGAQGGKQPITMLTSDIAMINDPQGEYQKISKRFAAEPAYFDKMFSEAWFKLTTRDMGPRERCLGPKIPPAQPWQNALPAVPAVIANFHDVHYDLVKLLKANPQDAHKFAQLAFKCANSFRVTDFRGGCNGARVRFAPEVDQPLFTAPDLDVKKVLKKLEAIKTKYGDKLSWADLIVLAGTTALNKAIGTSKIPFCGGRTDATDGAGSAQLVPLLKGTEADTLDNMRRTVQMSGLDYKEYVALIGGLQSLGPKMGMQSTSKPDRLDNDYLKNMVTQDFEPVANKPGLKKAKGEEIHAMHTDLLFTYDTGTLNHARILAGNNQLFLDSFVNAWTKLMNIDRYDGPLKNLCTETYKQLPKKWQGKVAMDKRMHKPLKESLLAHLRKLKEQSYKTLEQWLSQIETTLLTMSKADLKDKDAGCWEMAKKFKCDDQGVREKCAKSCGNICQYLANEGACKKTATKSYMDANCQRECKSQEGKYHGYANLKRQHGAWDTHLGVD